MSVTDESGSAMPPRACRMRESRATASPRAEADSPERGVGWLNPARLLFGAFLMERSVKPIA